MVTFLIIAAITGWVATAIALYVPREKLKEANRDIETLNQANYKLNEKIGQKTCAIAQLFIMLERVSEERAMYRKRAIDVEDAVEKSFGIAIRKEVTEVKVEFNKVEMVVLLSGIYKLLKGVKSVDDAKFYTNLIERVQSTIDKMPEDKVEGEPKK